MILPYLPVLYSISATLQIQVPTLHWQVEPNIKRDPFVITSPLEEKEIRRTPTSLPPNTPTISATSADTCRLGH
jgi:hypothetical protein